MAGWIDKAKLKFSITMGDGQVYYPLSMNANKSLEFNISEFDFRNLDGTLVNKRRRRGITYDLTLIFQGADHLDKATALQKSSYNTKPWTIQHPYYGTLGVQPITAVSFDNGNQVQGTTIIRVTVRETLDYKQVTTTAAPSDTIASAQQSTATHYAQYFVNAVPTPSVKDVQQMKSFIQKVQGIFNKISTSANEITNAYNHANAAIDAALNSPEGAIHATQYYLSLPAYIADTVANRVTYLANAFATLGEEIASLSLPDLKAIWFTEAGTVISAICVAAVTNISATDYQYSNQVNSIIRQIVTSYNAYLTGIDTLQAATGTDPGGWVADPQSITDLDNIVSLTISALYVYQANSLQARYVTLTRDSNVITIAWQIYGLIADDSTIDRIIADNNIGMNMLLQVPRGRQILYYA